MEKAGICPECGRKMTRTTYGANTVDHCSKCGYAVNVNTGKVIYGTEAKPGERIYLDCPNCSARLFTRKNCGIMRLDCPYCFHSWEYDTGAPSENSLFWNTNCPKCGKAVSINKNEGPRKIECPHCRQVWRFNSDTGEHLPDATVNDDHILVTCPECGTKNRVPKGKGNLFITCGLCSHQFYLLGNPNLIAKQDKQTQSSKAEPSKVSEQPKPKAPPKYEPQPEPIEQSPAPQNNEQEKQPGFFEGISNFFKERKEVAEAEEIFIEESSLTHYIGETLLNTMNDLRQQLRGGSPRDYFFLYVHKDYCDLDFYKYSEADSRYDNGELVIRIEYKTAQNIFQFKNGFTEIKSGKAKKWFRQVVYNEHMAKCGFLHMDNFDRICILRSQL